MNEFILSNDERLLKATDIARILNISRALSYRLLQTGEIPVVRIHRSVRIKPTDLEKYIQKCQVGWHSGEIHIE